MIIIIMNTKKNTSKDCDKRDNNNNNNNNNNNKTAYLLIKYKTIKRNKIVNKTTKHAYSTLSLTFSCQNACSSDPCLYKATCLSGFTDKGYRCLCPPGRTGERCEKGMS